MDYPQYRRILSRRNFFRDCGGGIGIAALASLLQSDGYAATAGANPLAPKPPMFPAKAKNVIFLFMEGGPSQLDLFDPKPELAKWDGQAPARIHHEGSPTRLHQAHRGRPGQPPPVCAARPIRHRDLRLPPHLLHSRADDICLVRSMHTDAFNHHPGQLLLFSGTTQVGRPSMGSWVTYGLGSESQNLPELRRALFGRGH